MSFYCTNIRRPFKQGKEFLDVRRSWLIQRDDVDTRALFYKYVSRKPASWEDVNVIFFPELPLAEQRALQRKKLVDMNLVEPWGNFPVTVTDTLEFILYNSFNSRFYYVNTEGFNYARYIFEVHGFTRN